MNNMTTQNNNRIDDRLKAIVTDNEFRNICRTIEHAEIDRVYCKHGLEHSLDVARIAYINVLEDNLEFNREMVYAACLLHDIGRYSDYEKNGMSHHVAGSIIAANILRRAGFLEQEIEVICDAISKHKECSKEENMLGYVLYKADKLSRNCFMCKEYDNCYWSEDIKNKTVYR